MDSSLLLAPPLKALDQLEPLQLPITILLEEQHPTPLALMEMPELHMEQLLPLETQPT